MTHSTIVLASGNAGKLRELKRILSVLPVTLHPQSQYDMPEVPEDGLSFVENAIIKARAVAGHTGLPAIADDSGLEVDYLNGAPGIYSARYSGEGDAGNNARLLSDLEGVPAKERGARYQCVLAYMRHAKDPNPVVCQGSWEGVILTAGRGKGGFGYDPLFYLPEYDCTAAELESSVKNQVSHRAHASQLLLDALQKQY